LPKGEKDWLGPSILDTLVSIKLSADDATLQKNFLALKRRDDVATLLDVTPKLLRYYLFKANKYRTFQIRKRSGELRTISSPDNALKIIQRKLNQVLHVVYKKRSPVHGFVRDRSIKTNALRHMGCEVVLNFDLENFFPGIHFGRVKGLFSKKPYNLPDQAALTLAQICCHETVLPAGAPTSPMIANMICASMDAKLKEVAYEFDCMYTRYADDITFSTKTRRFDPSIAYRDLSSKKWVVGERVKNIVEANQFKIHETKTHVRTKHSRQEVTGITINERLNVRRQLIRQVRAMLHAWENYGEEKAATEFLAKYNRKQRAKDKAEFRSVLRGKLEFLGFIRGRDDELYLRLLARFLSLAPEMLSRPVVALATTTDVVLTQAIWLLIADGGDPQATAFAADGFGLLTAFHTVEHVTKQGKTMYATRPGYDEKRYRISVVKFDEVRDVAQLSIDARCPLQLRIGADDHLHVGQQIVLMGFPRYHVGDGVAIHHGPIVQSKVYNKIPHFVIDPVIFRGNSGGPVLDAKNRVVGIAVKGYERPDRFTDKDELSSFVPIGMISYLRETEKIVTAAIPEISREEKPPGYRQGPAID